MPGEMIEKDYRVYGLPTGCVWSAVWWIPVKKPLFSTPKWNLKQFEQAHAFVPPAFLGRDVTEEDYGMARYWEKTRLHLL